MTLFVNYDNLCLDINLGKEDSEQKDYGILKERGYTNMETVLISLIVILGLVTITSLLTQKEIRKHITEVSFGNIFQFKTETEFTKES